MSSPSVVANLGAEEGHAQRELPAPAAAAAALFEHLVARDVPLLPWLPRGGELCAWLNTSEVAAQARRRGLSLYGADPDVTRRCHDKAFAQRAAGELGLTPAPLAAAISLLEPAELESAAALGAYVAAARARHPSQLAHGVLLKPRHGTSGRGHVRLAAGETPTEAATASLRRAGGAVLEPWHQRVCDLSVQLFVPTAGPVILVASPELLVTEHGGYRGHAGLIDARGRVTSGHRLEERMREDAVALAEAARAAGYTGPCGVDGYVYRDGERERLRSVAELNARFTVGTLLALWVRALYAQLRPARADARRAFQLALTPGRPLAGATPIRLDGHEAPVLWVSDAAEPLGAARADAD